MHSRRQRLIPTVAIIVAMLGAAAIMVSPITPWLLGVAACGAAGVAWGSAVLILWLVRQR